MHGASHTRIHVSASTHARTGPRTHASMRTHAQGRARAVSGLAALPLDALALPNPQHAIHALGAVLRGIISALEAGDGGSGGGGRSRDCGALAPHGAPGAALGGVAVGGGDGAPALAAAAAQGGAPQQQQQQQQQQQGQDAGVLLQGILGHCSELRRDVLQLRQQQCQQGGAGEGDEGAAATALAVHKQVGC